MSKAYQRRLDQLIQEVSNHTHKDELLKLMNEQTLSEYEYLYDLGIYTGTNK